jgi:hypothetical protein
LKVGIAIVNVGPYDDPRLRILRQPHNIGLISNWNACLRAARGAYIGTGLGER